jgi:hypothetical protein
VVFSAETGSWETIVSCWAAVIMLASTRNWRFFGKLERCHGRLYRRSYVLNVSERPVHHGIPESVRHFGGITKLDVNGWELRKHAT